MLPDLYLFTSEPFSLDVPLLSFVSFCYLYSQLQIINIYQEKPCPVKALEFTQKEVIQQIGQKWALDESHFLARDPTLSCPFWHISLFKIGLWFRFWFVIVMCTKVQRKPFCK